MENGVAVPVAPVTGAAGVTESQAPPLVVAAAAVTTICPVVALGAALLDEATTLCAAGVTVLLSSYVKLRPALGTLSRGKVETSRLTLMVCCAGAAPGVKRVKVSVHVPMGRLAVVS